MATFPQNLAKIRGEAIYGPDMRTAIAEALEQAQTPGEGDVTVEVTKIENNDYKLVLVQH